MPLIAVPTELREKLGSLESDQLVSLFEKVADEQKDRLFDLLEERFHRKIESEVHSLRVEMKEESSALRAEMQENNTSLRAELKEDIHGLRTEMKDGFIEMQKQFGEVQKQFAEMQKQFGETQKQITRQSQWMIGLIGFLAIALKVLDLIFK